ncbi:unnamed protein product [Blepharisma stoltei]|uniref:Survival motor neuron protein n=1 Tax=Blepharisma stoltei TaxID=1481888 RepID=A0AAU9I7K0_9CILI|nr:unnamed protein product [Blepharisma stoltei]
MEWDNDAIMKSFQKQIENCHEVGSTPIKPIDSRVEGGKSEIPMLLPQVEDPSLKPLLMAWYYAGYYSGRYQAFQEMKDNRQLK